MAQFVFLALCIMTTSVMSPAKVTATTKLNNVPCPTPANGRQHLRLRESDFFDGDIRFERVCAMKGCVDSRY